MNVGANTTLARLLGQLLEIVRALTRSSGIASKVGTRVATEAVLPLHIRIDGASAGISDEHAEALKRVISLG